MAIEIANLDAERSVIGSLICDRRVQDQASRLCVGDFTVPAFRRAFTEIQRLQSDKTPVDLVTVSERLNYNGNLMGELVDACRLTPLTFNCAAYVDLVLDAALRRNTSAVSEALYRAMGNPAQDAREAIAQARAGLADIGSGGMAAWMPSSEVAMRTLDDLESRWRGDIKPVLSGIRDLDQLTGGFFPGELTIVGAKPGAGKSVFGMMVAMNAASSGRSSGVCSLEMLDIQYGQRMISSLSGVDGMKLRKAPLISQDEWALICQAAGTLAQMPAAFMFAVRFVEDLALAARARQEKDKLDILVVDYLQLLRTRQRMESERLSVAAVSWALKTLACELRIPVLAMAQLRRPGQSEANRMPTMRDLRESGNIEADADNIILLHEPDHPEDPFVYKDDKPYFNELREGGDRYIAMKVEKQRQGSTGSLSVIFKPRQMQYVEPDRS